jgi:hypothetical protein
MEHTQYCTISRAERRLIPDVSDVQKDTHFHSDSSRVSARYKHLQFLSAHPVIAFIMGANAIHTGPLQSCVAPLRDPRLVNALK